MAVRIPGGRGSGLGGRLRGHRRGLDEEPEGRASAPRPSGSTRSSAAGPPTRPSTTETSAISGFRGTYFSNWSTFLLKSTCCLTPSTCSGVWCSPSWHAPWSRRLPHTPADRECQR
ncbi:hypothetical protein CEXT_187931 [Caerostris extrusa]|uniref:Uncharacterized protein n=1 Tax=Caerostris extrusa TaxID=172846 RepID=A0AAV4MLK5_CAEEX|nr:hypothetical protein CEXT_187931 [Caerostris extrusa]